MNHELYLQYLKAYTKDALEEADYDVSAAADTLLAKKEPGLFNKHRKEKRAALRRAKKVFDESRSRPVWIVLKSLGFDEWAKDLI